MRPPAVRDPTRVLPTPKPRPATCSEATGGSPVEPPDTAVGLTTSEWRPENPNIDRMELRRIVIEILG